MGDVVTIHFNPAGQLPNGAISHSSHKNTAAAAPTAGGRSLYCGTMPPTDAIVLLFSTCPDDACAERIAHALVSEGLAACVTRLPGARSLYRWQGVIEQADEVQLLIKTHRDRLPAALARLQALHPYELPEALAITASGGLPAYLQWVDAATREET
jgi:periplasmic divalent cation tolerance protein